MISYEKKILNALLDSYENSLLSRGENKVAVHIAFRFTKASMPAYFDESSAAYDEIHACLQELEAKGFVRVQWRDNVPGHIVQKVILQEEHAEEVYRYLKRTPKAVYSRRQEQLLARLQEECTTPVAAAFITWLRQRLAENLPVKGYFDLADLQKSERLIRCVYDVETNEKPCYVREFSILHYGDSKAFETIKSTVRKVFARFDERFADADDRAVFAEYGIYETPNYVYLKGEGVLELLGSADSGSTAGYECCPADALRQETVQTSLSFSLPLHELQQGIGISGEDLDRIRVRGTAKTQRVITIENLTTFFQWHEPDSLLIYLGGYHNRTRRRLLQMIHAQLPDADYLHFGDIDAGGFAIYEDLCKKTGIPFGLYHMGIEELQMYQAYTKKLTVSDKKRIGLMLEKAADTCPYRDTLEYMLAQGVKLEQECIQA